ncbi:hypothetical protein AB5J72_33270 [Streptomyces sp. CG1]|uniref:hypothetical protein n=1 Tax=Streptomyces sp. CG1 TaxID=1287523 RepID=UPI0034E2540A
MVPADARELRAVEVAAFLVARGEVVGSHAQCPEQRLEGEVGRDGSALVSVQVDEEGTAGEPSPATSLVRGRSCERGLADTAEARAAVTGTAVEAFAAPGSRAVGAAP